MQNELSQATKRIKNYQYKLVVTKSTYDTVSDECDHLKLVAEDLKRKVESFNQSMLDSEDETMSACWRDYMNWNIIL